MEITVSLHCYQVIKSTGPNLHVITLDTCLKCLCSLQLFPFHQALCSAITPVRVQFEVNGKGVPEGFFERKWIAHFAGDELELISKALPLPVAPEAA